MPYIDIGTYEGFIPEEKKEELAEKVRTLVAKEISRAEGTFVVTLTGVPQEEWKDYVQKLKEEKEVVLDFDKTKL